MPENIITIEISIKDGKLLWYKNGELSDAVFDTGDTDSESNVRVELDTTKVFHKVLGVLKQDPDLLEKKDFELLGELLSMILFGRRKTDWRGVAIRGDIMRFLNTGADACCRLILSFDYESRLANLPWEYTMLRLRPQGDNCYMSASKRLRFHLIRRLPGQDTPFKDPDGDRLFVIQLLSLDAGPKAEPPIDTRLDKRADILKVQATLGKCFPDRVVWATIDRPDAASLPAAIEQIIKGWTREYGVAKPAWVLHYVGHAFLDDQTGKLAMKPDEDNAIDWMIDQDFAGLCSNDTLSVPPAVVLLQACDSAKIGMTDGTLRGIAYELTQKNIPAIIGMQNEINTDKSNAFCYKFYESLLNGVDIAEAVTTGRAHLGVDKKDFIGNQIQPAGKSYESNYFGSPVLFITTETPIRLVKPVQAEPWAGRVGDKPVSGPAERIDLQRGIVRPTGEVQPEERTADKGISEGAVDKREEQRWNINPNPSS
jgi:hypothetical protein